MSFHLREEVEEHAALLTSALHSGEKEHQLYLVTEEGWLLPSSRLLLTLHSPLLAPPLSTGSSSPSSAGSVLEVQELAATLGIPLTNCTTELQRTKAWKTSSVNMTYQPDPLQPKEEPNLKKKAPKRKTKRKETGPANFEVFSNRDEKFGQWTEGKVEPGETQETDTAKDLVTDNMAVEVLLLPAAAIVQESDGNLSDQTDFNGENNVNISSSLVSDEYDPTNDLVDNVVARSGDIASTDNIITEEWPCTLCPKKFAKEMYLENHKTKMHQNSAPGEVIEEWQCKDCPKKFSGEDHLIKHYARIHKKVQKGIYQCGLCSKSYNTVPEFNSHKTSVHMGKCAVCEKDMLKVSLSGHMKNKHSEIIQ